MEASSGDTTHTRFAGAAAVALCFAALTAFTWMCWPDVLIDFGREITIAWRLSQGEHLHRDIAYFSGALSPYFNAACLRLFGVGIHTLVFVNLVILAIFAALLYTMVARIATAATAAAGCILMLTLCGFAQLMYASSYNWIAPYAHDMTHGVVFATASLGAAWRFSRGCGAVWLKISGVLVGLAFLTRPEVFLAASLAVSLHLAASAWRERLGSAQLAQNAAVLALSALAVPLVAYALLAWSVDPASARLDLLGTWPITLAGQVARLPNFQVSFGIAPMPFAAIEMGVGIAIYTALWLMILFFAHRRTGPLWRAQSAGTAGGVLAIVFLAVQWQSAVPAPLTRPLPIFLGVLLLGLARELWQRREAGCASPRDVERLSFTFLALALLAKILFHTRFEHYGAFCTGPALVATTAALFAWAPALLERRGGTGAACQLFLGPSFVVLWLLAIQATAIFNGPPLREMPTLGKAVSVGRPEDTFWADKRGLAINKALAWLEANTRPHETLVTLPDGAMLNFLSRRGSSVRHTNFMPTEMLIFGEAQILDCLKGNPPDYITLVAKDTSEYGARFFGVDYARSIHAWIKAHYHDAHLVWRRPFESRGFGILILARNRDSTPGLSGSTNSSTEAPSAPPPP